VDRIGEKLGFTASSNVSADIKQQLHTAFTKFQNYLLGIGYHAKGDRIGVDVRDKMDSPGNIAYYDPENSMMVIDRRFASDPDLLYREYMHHVLYSVRGVPSDPMALWAYNSIESGLATYFPCSFNDNPKLAEKTAAIYGEGFHIQDLSRVRQFSELRPESGLAILNGEIWGSVFWELRQNLRKGPSDRLLLDAWFKLEPGEVRTDQGASFVRKLLEVDDGLGKGEHKELIRRIFKNHGLSI
jgi:hypothetical protein